MYWIVTPRMLTWRNQSIQAKLVENSLKKYRGEYREQGFSSPLQLKPYGVNLQLTYQVRAEHPHPDMYMDDVGFLLCSQRLVDLFQQSNVLMEVFPVTMVDRKENILAHLSYSVVHVLDGPVDVIDAEASEWMEASAQDIPRLVINESRAGGRPLFICDKVYLMLMRDDLRQSIRAHRMTGVGFLNPLKYHSGIYGLLPDLED